MTLPRFSIIVPVYKTERFLTECLLSVRAQSHAEFECLVVDDGSPGVTTDDGSLLRARAIFDQAVGGDARFHYHLQANAGQGVAKNAGLQLAQGQYVVFLDADDYLDTDFLRYAAQSLTEREENTWYFNTVRVHREAEILPFSAAYRYLPKDNTVLMSLVLPFWTITAVNYFYPRELLERHQVRFRIPRYGEDTLFFWDAMLAWFREKGQLPRLEPIPRSVYYYRIFRSADAPQTTKAAGFDLTLSQNLMTYLRSQASAIHALGLRARLFAWLFILRLQCYVRRGQARQRLGQKFWNLCGKILALIALGIATALFSSRQPSGAIKR